MASNDISLSVGRYALYVLRTLAEKVWLRLTLIKTNRSRYFQQFRSNLKSRILVPHNRHVYRRSFLNYFGFLASRVSKKFSVLCQQKRVGKKASRPTDTSFVKLQNFLNNTSTKNLSASSLLRASNRSEYYPSTAISTVRV